jgi:hypothetical protein
MCFVHVLLHVDRIALFLIGACKMYKVCILLDHISLGLIVIYKDVEIFYVVFEDFLNDPLILVLTLQNRNLCFCVFLSCRNHLDVEPAQSFWYIFF